MSVYKAADSSQMFYCCWVFTNQLMLSLESHILANLIYISDITSVELQKRIKNLVLQN